ncbi:MAG: hypothetical protein N3D73_00995 [Candidatus Diapherotrites archaeon]|nr:hypothetical protein [Candidatus Diapherotrites archaeon]
MQIKQKPRKPVEQINKTLGNVVIKKTASKVGEELYKSIRNIKSEVIKEREYIPEKKSYELWKHEAIDSLLKYEDVYAKRLGLTQEEIRIRKQIIETLRKINNWDEFWRFLQENGIKKEIYDKIFHLEERKQIYAIFHPNEIVDAKRMELRTPK